MANYDINEQWTLLDRSKATADGKTTLPMIRIMDKKIDNFFMDVPFVECNSGLRHRVRRANQMTESTNRSFYSGVGSTKQGSQIVFEPVMLKERRREIDEDEIDTLANGKEELKRQDMSHMMRLGEDVVDAFFNGGVTDGAENVRGLLARLASLNPSGTGNGLDNVLSNGNSNASYNTSIFIIEWAINEGAYGLYPPGFMKNTELGVSARDKQKEKVLDADDSTAAFYAYVAQFKAWLGLAVGDNLKIARLSNINTDVDSASNFISGNGHRRLFELLNRGRFDRSRTRLYMNSEMKTQFDILGSDKSNLFLSSREVFGRPVDVFQEIPIRVLDNTIIKTTETVVT